MPDAVVKVHRLAEELESLRRNNPELSWIQSDGKTQITVQDGKIKTVLVSTQHDENVDNETIRDSLIKHLIAPIIGDLNEIEILVNPTGKFVQGGFFNSRYWPYWPKNNG